MLFFTLFALCTSGLAVGAVPALGKPFYPESTHAQHFEEFKATYNKQYATLEEEQHRFEIFQSNLNRINELNAEYEDTEYGITKFADLTSEEVVSEYTGLVLDETRRSGPPPPTNFSNVRAPEAFDWRDKQVVTKVKDQRRCGSCWAFATIGSLESNFARKTGKLQEFSEQQLVDCDKADGNGGCQGGNPVTACEYIMSKGEIAETMYPYIGHDSQCAYAPNEVLAKATKCQNYAHTSEEDMKTVLYTKGPIVLGVDASSFGLYQKGIFRHCDNTGLNHAVLLVGYGTDNGVPFWTIKNSWGEGYGEQGYIRVERGNNCVGLTNDIVLPVEV